MTRPAALVLVPSPFLGPASWAPTAAALRAAGRQVVVPALHDDGSPPFWRQHAAAVAAAVDAGLAPATPVVLAGHSGAGPLLPAAGALLAGRVAAYAFVDAGLPRDGATRLELLAGELPDLAPGLAQLLAGGGRFPEWTVTGLAVDLPDRADRERVLAELRPRGAPFFNEPVPVLATWPDAPVGYLQLTPAYAAAAGQARQRGWPLRTAPGGHLAPAAGPRGVAGVLQALADLLTTAAVPDPSALRYDERGLVTAVVQQHDSGEVLMVAWMTRETLAETLRTGETVFWSRSRGQAWRKGATSGNAQRVVEVVADCDGDVVLLRVDQGGPGAACHTGARSCFNRPVVAP